MSIFGSGGRFSSNLRNKADDWQSNNTFLDSNYLQGLGFNYDDDTDTDLGWIDQNGMRFGTSWDDDNNLLENFNYTLGDGGIWVGNDVWDQWKGTYDPIGGATESVVDATNTVIDSFGNPDFNLWGTPEGGFTPAQVADVLGNTDPDPITDDPTDPTDNTTHPEFDPLDHNQDGIVNYLDFMGNAPIWGEGEFDFTGTAPGAFNFNPNTVTMDDPGYLFGLRELEKTMAGRAAAQGLLGSGGYMKALGRNVLGYASEMYGDAYDRQYDLAKEKYGSEVDTYLRDWGQMYTDYNTINDQYWNNIEAATGIQGLGAEAAGQAGDIMFESADSFVDVIAAMTGIQIDNAQTLGEIEAALATGDIQGAFQVAQLAIDAVGAFGGGGTGGGNS